MVIIKDTHWHDSLADFIKITYVGHVSPENIYLALTVIIYSITEKKKKTKTNSTYIL